MTRKEWGWVLAVGVIGWYLYQRSRQSSIVALTGQPSGPVIPVGVNGTVSVPVDALTSVVVSALRNLSPL